MRRTRLLALAFAAFALVLVGTASAHGGRDDHGHRGHHQPSHWPPPGHPPGHGNAPDPLSAEALMTTIRQYGSLPDHYSGTRNDAWALGQAAKRFAADGLRLGSVSYAFPQFEPTRVSLRTDSGSVSSSALAPLLYSGTTPAAGLTGPLLDAGNGSFDPSAAAGKVVVASAPAGARLEPTIAAAIAGGAKALVFVTAGLGDLPRKEDINARQGTGTFPVLLVGKQSGADVLADADAGQSARLVLTAKTGTACDSDVWGVLPGQDPSRRVFVGTPVSSFVPAASERGGGVAVMLGLADHYAQVPRAQRPESLVFLATSGHETGFLGLQALIEATGDWYTGADAYVHLGASVGAPQAVENADGSVTVTPGVQAAGGSLRPSENPVLQALTHDAFTAAGAGLSEVEPHVSGSGEQMWAYAAGIPTLSFNGGSLWFHTAADLPSVVDPGLLAREADGFRRAVDAITALPPGALRAANGQADAYGAAIDPNVPSPHNPVLADGVGGPAPVIVPSCAGYLS